MLCSLVVLLGYVQPKCFSDILPCSIDEAEDEGTRGVWLIDSAQGYVPVLCPAPAIRSFHRLKGSIEDIEERIAKLQWEEEQEPPFVWLQVVSKTPRYDLKEIFEKCLSAYPSMPPIIMDIDNILEDDSPQGGAQNVDIKTTPQEIFDLLLKTKGIANTPKMQELFSLLLAQHNESTPHEDV